MKVEVASFPFFDWLLHRTVRTARYDKSIDVALHENLVAVVVRVVLAVDASVAGEAVVVGLVVVVFAWKNMAVVGVVEDVDGDAYVLVVDLQQV